MDDVQRLEILAIAERQSLFETRCGGVEVRAHATDGRLRDQSGGDLLRCAHSPAEIQFFVDVGERTGTIAEIRTRVGDLVQAVRRIWRRHPVRA